MNRRSTPIALAVLLAAGVAWPHGASRGLHVHILEDHACPGRTITVELDASRPVRSIRAGFVGEQPVRVEPDPPTREHSIELRVPASPHRHSEEPAPPSTLSVQVEARTTDGTKLRAAAIVKLGRTDAVDACPEPVPGTVNGGRGPDG